MALHTTNTAIKTFRDEWGRWSRAWGETGWVIHDIGIEEGIVGVGEYDAEWTVVAESFTILAFDITVGTGGLVCGICATIDIPLILSYWAVAFACIGISPFIISINTGITMKISWSIACHTPKITHLAYISIVSIVYVTLTKSRPWTSI
jgi:hypothetical protein